MIKVSNFENATKNFFLRKKIGVLPSWFNTYKPSAQDVLDCIPIKPIAITALTMAASNAMFGVVGAVIGFCGVTLYVLLNERKSYTGWFLKPINQEVAPEVLEEIAEIEEPQQTGFSIQAMQDTLDSNNVAATIVGYDDKGPRLILYKIKVKAGFNINMVSNLGDNFSRDLGLPAGVRVTVEANIGDGLAGLLIPKTTFDPISTTQLLQFKCDEHIIPCLIGKDYLGNVSTFDFAKAGHTLVGGQSGGGKSIQIANMILSMAFYAPPSLLQMTMIDPKKVEMSIFKSIPHLTQPPITDMTYATGILETLKAIMLERYQILEAAGVRNISEYNKHTKEKMPYHVVMVDEVGNLVMDSTPAYPDMKGSKATVGDVCEANLIAIAQMGRACGMLLLLGTQRFDAKTFDGQLRSNILSTIGFKVRKSSESVMLIEQAGCELLSGKGDCLVLLSGETSPTRMQAAYINEDDISTLLSTIVQKWSTNDISGETV
jgi:S-DNA-T family DNA segregation ATPase FtsK/SpoIIIE